VAMSAVFVACLALPDAFHDVPGGLDAATIVVVSYAVVRLTHAATYLVAAGDDARLRRQVLVTVAMSLVPTLTLLAIGAAVGAPGQRWVWLGAVVYDFASVFVTATLAQGWVIHSAAHFTERHGLIVILALGESIIATGTGLEGTILTWRVVVGAVLSLMVAIGLYTAYFRRLPDLFEETLSSVHGAERARVGTDVFTYLHFLLIAGVIVTALGVEQAMGHLDAEHLGSLGGWALGVGVALFLTGTILAVVRCSGRWPVARVVIALLLVACSPFLAHVPPLLAAAVTAAALGALSVTESVRPVA
jgi:low temperature requirement protein LtrA